MSYQDNDGLLRKYGTERATAKTAGEYHMYGHLHEVEVKIDLTDLTATETILDDTVMIPKNARIQDVQVVTHTAAATGTAIDLGLIAADRSTETDYNGFLAALPTASMNAAGEKNDVTIGHTYVGALIGTTLSNPAYISASRTDATAFTAGIIYVTIRYYVA